MTPYTSDLRNQAQKRVVLANSGWVNTILGNVKQSLDWTHQRLPRAAAAALPLPRPVLELHPYGR